ncbi:carboxymuconolactone decarboxylase family protein [Paraglaciecola chathamensis]|uniref:Carboxymuconolactone decarboxylase family protein n=1 Tax=Paraglaciecola chathamensis S18K6 TaxID=1127672 RepID=A0AAV3V3P8_9ALTE|nr:carboxymuconolactone decarboxylase family protein [Paraglaciecola chathamensis]GAC11698.1 carboxymuconolactone decarboxylase family protein [Paraglaciecola chathamensis S18K6]
MSRLSALSIDALPDDLKATMMAGENIMGFTPNDGLIMARAPEMLNAFLGLVQSIYQPSALDNDLKKLLGLMTSSASGCQYCQAHTQYGALKHGITEQKIAAIWEYQTSDLFSPAEREALDVARNAALVPNAVTDEQFERLKSHFSEVQIVEIVGVISLFGFLNRWNATFKTDIEAAPAMASAKFTSVV